MAMQENQKNLRTREISKNRSRIDFIPIRLDTVLMQIDFRLIVIEVDFSGSHTKKPIPYRLEILSSTTLRNYPHF